MPNPFQPIQMLEMRFNYFPRQFRWGAEIINVVSIERTVTSNKQFLFRVRAEDNRYYDIIQTLKTKTWQASLVPAPKVKA